MAKIVMIVPTEEMYSQAKAIAANLNVELDVYYESSQTVLDRLARAQREGALVAIARGNHANLILKSMDISLIEIRLSGQSLAKLIVEAKDMVKKDHPCIGFLGFPNMFTETKVFGQLLDVTIRNYFVEDSDKIEEAVENAYKHGVDVLIGGEIALRHAMELGMSSLFLRSGEVDIEAAFRSAKRVLYAIEMEKKNTAEVSHSSIILLTVFFVLTAKALSQWPITWPSEFFIDGRTNWWASMSLECSTFRTARPS